MDDEMDGGGTIRLAKLIARRGLCSRRDAEEWIAAGRVTVDGQVVTEPVGVDPERQVVKVDGKRLPAEPRSTYLLMYKPRGYITGRDDPEGRPSVHDLLPENVGRLEPVGRLDFDTEGALLLTNDGELAHRLTHPSMMVPKRYLAKVYRRPSPEQLEQIEKGQVFLEDGRVAPARVRVVESTDKENCWVEITVTEGRNRLIRRLFAQLHHPVSKLRRESFATISIRGLERGQVRPLTGGEVRRLKQIAEGVKPSVAGSKSKAGFAKAKKVVKRNIRRS
ncbi:MAG TPA: pseudouridine synthase [Myxococcota bacterium]|nr:pseudouridine synthase [Myxococcota bacterium]